MTIEKKQLEILGILLIAMMFVISIGIIFNFVKLYRKVKSIKSVVKNPFGDDLPIGVQQMPVKPDLNIILVNQSFKNLINTSVNSS